MLYNIFVCLQRAHGVTVVCTFLSAGVSTSSSCVVGSRVVRMTSFRFCHHHYQHYACCKVVLGEWWFASRNSVPLTQFYKPGETNPVSTISLNWRIWCKIIVMFQPKVIYLPRLWYIAHCGRCYWLQTFRCHCTSCLIALSECLANVNAKWQCTIMTTWHISSKT